MARSKTVSVDAVLRKLRLLAHQLDKQLAPPQNPPGSLERIRIIYRLAGVHDAISAVRGVAEHSPKRKRNGA